MLNFFHSVTGKKSNRWNIVTIRLGTLRLVLLTGTNFSGIIDAFGGYLNLAILKHSITTIILITRKEIHFFNIRGYFY